MSTSLELLLGPAPPGTPAHRRRLRSDDGIALRLTSNAGDDQVMLLSSPGHLPPGTELGPPRSLWHHTLAHPRRPGLRLSLVVPAGSVRVHLMDVWPRHAVPPQALAEVLDEHSRRHRLWRAALAADGTEDHGAIDGTRLTPDHWAILPHPYA